MVTVLINFAITFAADHQWIERCSVCLFIVYLPLQVMAFDSDDVALFIAVAGILSVFAQV